MPTPRKSQISVDATPYLHCVSQCVRRVFLCGQDRFTGRSFEHRRQFIESELLRLSQVFFLDLVAYAVMSNHFHTVLFINQSAKNDAAAEDILRRWHQIHRGNPISAKFLNYKDSHRKKEVWNKELQTNYRDSHRKKRSGIENPRLSPRLVLDNSGIREDVAGSGGWKNERITGTVVVKRRLN